MSKEKQPKLFVVFAGNPTQQFVKAFTKAQAKGWSAAKIDVHEVKALDAVDIDPSQILDATEKAD